MLHFAHETYCTAVASTMTFNQLKGDFKAWLLDIARADSQKT